MEGSSMAANQAAPAVCSTFFFAIFLVNVAGLWRTRFRLYVPASLSCLVRGVALACRAQFFRSGQEGLLAAWKALTDTGLGIHIFLCSLLVVGWVRHVAQPYTPRWRKMLVLTAQSSSALHIALGPVLGILTIIIMSAAPKHSAEEAEYKQAAGRMGCVVDWGLELTVLPVFGMVVGLCALAAWHHATTTEPPVTGFKHWGVFLFLPVVGLLIISTSTRVAAIYHPRYLSDANLYYPLIILPEMLSILILALPLMIPKLGLAGHYKEWVVLQQRQKLQQQLEEEEEQKEEEASKEKDLQQTGSSSSSSSWWRRWRHRQDRRQRNRLKTTPLREIQLDKDAEEQ